MLHERPRLDEMLCFTPTPHFTLSMLLGVLKLELHDRSRGNLRLHARRDVLIEMETLAHTSPVQILAMSQFLLDMDFDSLYNSSFKRQSYWVRAMRAARRAGRRAAHITMRTRRRITLQFVLTNNVPTDV